jgi:hypothetical protein
MLDDGHTFVDGIFQLCDFGLRLCKSDNQGLAKPLQLVAFGLRSL